MTPPYSTPQDAVIGLVKAYRTRDVEQIVLNKDFDMDSRLFWEGLGLPVSSEQLKQSRVSFENNFRKEMEEEMPDYRSTEFGIVAEEQPQDNLAIITIAGLTSEGTFDLKIPVLKTENGWKVVLLSGYDHL